MRNSHVANALLASSLLVSCASMTHSGNSSWDGVDYAHPSRAVSHVRDYDADYSLPASAGCMDDAPNCR